VGCVVHESDVRRAGCVVHAPDDMDVGALRATVGASHPAHRRIAVAAAALNPGIRDRDGCGSGS
jgi:hypothetical protein